MRENETSINSLTDSFNTDQKNAEESLFNHPTKKSTSPTFTTHIRNPKFQKAILWLSIFTLIIGLAGLGYIFYTEKHGKEIPNIKAPIVLDPKKKTLPNKTFTDDELGEATNTDYPNPTNGMYLSKERYERIKNLKPIAITLNNHVASRPQAGISQADIIYEIVAEGGISRLLAIFHSRIPEKVMSIRSARIYFEQVAAEYWPIFAHWGIAYRPDYELNLSLQAFQDLLNRGEAETDPRADARSYIDEIALPVANTDTTPNIYHHDTDLINAGLATEHTGYVEFSKIYEEFRKYYPEPSWSTFQDFDTWNFKDLPEKTETATKVNSIFYNFWDFPGFETTWTYNPEKNTYTREQGGIITKDRNNDKTVEVKNIIIQMATETKLGDKKGHLMYDVISEGTATFYIDGGKITGTWSKPSARERTVFKDALGNDISFNRGLFWIVILPQYSVVKEN